MRKCLSLCFLVLAYTSLQAQIGLDKGFELNARVTINHSNIPGTGHEQLFNNLEIQISEFLNNRRWTGATFTSDERIDCSFGLVIKEMPAETHFKGELLVQASRPVYNSSYSTTLLNYRDTQLDFEYYEMQPFEYDGNTLNSNLTATLVYYVYLILGLDFDSFGLNAGTPYYQQAYQIVSLAQTERDWSGWDAFARSRNRHTIITAMTDNMSGVFRQFWYDYHRKGLDELVANADRGRMNIISYMDVLKQLYKQKPTSALFQLFADAKMDEVIGLYSKASMREKQEGYELLSTIYPGMATRLEAMKQ